MCVEINICSDNGYGSMDWQSEVAIQQESYFDAFPLMGSVPDPLYTSQDIVPVPKMTQGECFNMDFFYNYQHVIFLIYF